MSILTIIETPFSGDQELNIAYARLCCRDAIENFGEVPFASHLFFTQFLDDNDETEREIGLYAGFKFHELAMQSVAYIDLGVSSGMILGRTHAETLGVPTGHQRRLFRDLDHRKSADLEKLRSTIVKKSLTLPPYCVT